MSEVTLVLTSELLQELVSFFICLGITLVSGSSSVKKHCIMVHVAGITTIFFLAHITKGMVNLVDIGA